MRLRLRSLCCCAGAALLLAGCGLSGAMPVQACSLDNKPSVSADGQLAQFNQATPTTSAQLATWALFAFNRSFAARHAVVLTENRREVAKTLLAAAMRRPWRWHFGDGQLGYGWTVRHAYVHPGRWRIEVDAYDPDNRQWYNFDQVVITIVR